MPFTLLLAETAAALLGEMGEQAQYEKKLRKIRRTLGRIETDPQRPGLNSHKYASIRGLKGEEVWESYVENEAAWRVFWHYGPGRDVIAILTIGPRP